MSRTRRSHTEASQPVYIFVPFATALLCGSFLSDPCCYTYFSFFPHCLPRLPQVSVCPRFVSSVIGPTRCFLAPPVHSTILRCDQPHSSAQRQVQHQSRTRKLSPTPHPSCELQTPTQSTPPTSSLPTFDRHTSLYGRSMLSSQAWMTK